MKRRLTVSGSLDKWLAVSKSALKRMRLKDIETDEIFYTVTGIHPEYGKISIGVKGGNQGKVNLDIDIESPELLSAFKRAASLVIKESATKSEDGGTEKEEKENIKKRRAGKKVILALVAIISVALVAVGAYDLTFRNLYGKSVFEKKTEYALNETAEVNGLSIKFSSYEEVVLPNDPDQLIQFNPPEGCIPLAIGFDVTNNTDKTVTLSSVQFTGYADGKSVTEDVTLSLLAGSSLMDGSISPGMTKTGGLIFDFPTTWSSGQIDFRYDTNKEPIKFVFQK